MKKLKSFFSNAALVYCVALFFSLTNGIIYAQPAGLPGEDIDSNLRFKLAVKGVREVNKITRWVFNKDDPDGSIRHCNNPYLFPTYVGSVDTYTLGSIVPGIGRSPFAVQWRIYENGVYTYPASGFASGTEGVPIPWSFSTPGYKYFQFIVDDPLLGPRDTIVAKVLVMKRVTDLTFNMPTICMEDLASTSDYKFKVETTPSVETIFTEVPSYEYAWNGTYCEAAGDLSIDFKFEAAPTSAFSALPKSEFAPWASYIYGTFSLGGYSTPVWPTVLPSSPWSDVPKFYYSNADIMTFVSTSNAPIVGKLTYSDGISTLSKNYVLPVSKPADAGTGNNASTFYIWEYNKRSPGYISNHTAEPFGTIDAPANETWTPTDNPMVNEGFGALVDTIRIKDKLVIGKGQSLTIKNMVVEMGKEAQIIVESDPAGIVAAGRLTLDNSTIKSYRGCGNETNFWRGLFLHGNSSQSQAYMSSSSFDRHQATLWMYNSAKIAEARVGVGTYDPDNAPTRAGGVIMADNAIFENNMLSVDISNYYNATPVTYFTGYVSRFNYCTFTFNNENTKSNFQGFVNVVGVKDIPFTSCNFTTDFGSAMLGYGIRAVDASLLLRRDWTYYAPCYFKGLHDAVSAYKTAFGTTTTLYISGAQFTGNYTGVFSNAVNNPYMQGNVFQVPPRPTPSFAGRNCSGVNIASGSGYTLTGNSFTSVSGSRANNNAALIWNSGSADNTVRGNTVSSLSQGMISNFINRGTSAPATGLQFLCNAQSSNVGTCIAALGGNPSQDGMRAEQGNNSLAAGNTFAHLYTDIYNPTADVGALTYFHNSATNAEPIILVGSASKSATTASDDCAVTLPVISSTTGTTGTTGTPVVSVPGPVIVSGLTGIALREALLHNVAAYSLADTQSNRVSLLHSTLAALGDAYSDLERVDLYLQSNEIEAANNLYDGIVANRALSGTEAYEFSHWGRQLLDISIAQRQAAKTTRELNSTQVSTLTTIADSAAMWAKVRAQNWLLLYDGRTYTNTFLYPPDSMGGNQRRVMDNSLTAAEAQQNEVYPNPAKNYIDVMYHFQNEKAQTVVLELRDMMGRIVLSQNLNNKGTQRVGIENLPPSLYLYRIIEDGESKLDGKLLKQ